MTDRPKLYAIKGGADVPEEVPKKRRLPVMRLRILNLILDHMQDQVTSSAILQNKPMLVFVRGRHIYVDRLLLLEELCQEDKSFQRKKRINDALARLESPVADYKGLAKEQFKDINVNVVKKFAQNHRVFPADLFSALISISHESGTNNTNIRITIREREDRLYYIKTYRKLFEQYFGKQ